MLGILLVNKPVGITSHDAVYAVRRKFQTKRVGHAGTLDPLASGLLVVAVGPATRFLQYLPLEPKEYVAVFRFGQTTETFDAEGEVDVERPVPIDLDAQIHDQLPNLIGEIEQLPPMFSAVKRDGRPLYELARQGIEVERRPRRVFIEAFERLDSEEGSDRTFRIVCSGGTYVRTLAHDLGQLVGCGAHVVDLVRTGVGRFRVDDAVELEEMAEPDLLPLVDALAPMAMVTLNSTQIGFVRDGRSIPAKRMISDRFVGLLDETGNVFSVGRVEGMQVSPECVIPAGANSAAAASS